MRETKDQKIERLEKVIDEQKKEMTQIKKDRKRLNYAVERLERANQRLTINLTVNSSTETPNIEIENEKCIATIPSDNEITDIPKSEIEELYWLSVSWNIGTVPDDFIQRLERIYRNSGMEKMEESDFILNANEMERTISYAMPPNTLGCIEVGKRMTNALKKHYDPSSHYHISCYAKRIK